MKPEIYYLKVTFCQIGHQIFYACKIVFFPFCHKFQKSLEIWLFIFFAGDTKTFAGITFLSITQASRNLQKLLPAKITYFKVERNSRRTYIIHR